MRLACPWSCAFFLLTVLLDWSSPVCDHKVEEPGASHAVESGSGKQSFQGMTCIALPYHAMPGQAEAAWEQLGYLWPPTVRTTACVLTS